MGSSTSSSYDRVDIGLEYESLLNGVFAALLLEVPLPEDEARPADSTCQVINTPPIGQQ